MPRLKRETWSTKEPAPIMGLNLPWKNSFHMDSMHYSQAPCMKPNISQVMASNGTRPSTEILCTTSWGEKNSKWGKNAEILFRSTLNSLMQEADITHLLTWKPRRPQGRKSCWEIPMPFPNVIPISTGWISKPDLPSTAKKSGSPKPSILTFRM